MRFTITTVSALVASATAAAVPRADQGYGSWDVSYSVSSSASGYQSKKITAVYNNSQLNDTITATCSYLNDPQQDPHETSSCDPESFIYSLGFDGESNTIVSLSQTVPLSSEDVTVKGSAPYTLRCDSGSGRYCTFQVTVPVTEAVA